MLYLGIDVSVHNGAINVKKIRDAGYERIIIRAGYGKNNIDQKYISNAEACVNLSQPAGIYWFSYAFTEEMATNEAKYAIEAAKKYWKKCPVAFDFEYESVSYARKKGVDINKSLATKMAISFLKVVVSEGFVPVLYTNNDYTKNYFDIQAIKEALETELYIWYARYTTNLTTDEKELAHIWQKSNKGKIPGISGNVDINEFYTELHNITKNEEEKEIVSNINILNFQRAANKDGFKDQDGNALVEDGIDGKRTRYVRRKVSLKAKKSALGYQTHSVGELVLLWQTRLGELGFYTEVDGEFGKDTRAKTIQCQRKLNLTPDGVVGYNTFSMSFYN